MRFENPDLIQVLKEFFEGSDTMFADIKYKDLDLTQNRWEWL